MSSRLGVAIAITIAFVFLSVLGLFALRSAVDDVPAEPEAGTGIATALADPAPARAPFEGMTEAQLALADRCLLIVVADEDSERVEGLRNVVDLGAYEGMLFVYDEDVAARFTMADTPLPLDIGFHAADGTLVSRTTMEPCPEGSDASCPTYASDRPFRYALETPAGAATAGAIGACS
jgi:uncharacterized membrane protein (UPF0127 family)